MLLYDHQQLPVFAFFSCLVFNFHNVCGVSVFIFSVFINVDVCSHGAASTTCICSCIVLFFFCGLKKQNISFIQRIDGLLSSLLSWKKANCPCFD